MITTICLTDPVRKKAQSYTLCREQKRSSGVDERGSCRHLGAAAAPSLVALPASAGGRPARLFHSPPTCMYIGSWGAVMVGLHHGWVRHELRLHHEGATLLTFARRHRLKIQPRCSKGKGAGAAVCGSRGLCWEEGVAIGTQKVDLIVGASESSR